MCGCREKEVQNVKKRAAYTMHAQTPHDRHCKVDYIAADMNTNQVTAPKKNAGKQAVKK